MAKKRELDPSKSLKKRDFWIKILEGIWLPFERYLLETTKKATLPWLPFECYLLETTKKSVCLKTCKLPFERYLLEATKNTLCRKT